jgi:hypothetical protein
MLFSNILNPCQACVLAQAASRRAVTTEAWFRSQARSYEICGGQNGTGISLQVLRFSRLKVIPPMLDTLSFIPLSVTGVT